MIKKLFIEILPITYASYSFHEMSVVVMIDNDIKVAYQFKVKPENVGVDYGLIESQGYTYEEICENPQYSYEVYSQIAKILDLYINKSSKSDRFLLYGWNGLYAFDCLVDFLNSNGLRNLNDYFILQPVDIRSVVVDSAKTSTLDLENFDLNQLCKRFLNVNTKKDSLSRLVNIIKLYNFVKS